MKNINMTLFINLWYYPKDIEDIILIKGSAVSLLEHAYSIPDLKGKWLKEVV